MSHRDPEHSLEEFPTKQKKAKYSPKKCVVLFYNLLIYKISTKYLDSLAYKALLKVESHCRSDIFSLYLHENVSWMDIYGIDL